MCLRPGLVPGQVMGGVGVWFGAGWDYSKRSGYGLKVGVGFGAVEVAGLRWLRYVRPCASALSELSLTRSRASVHMCMHMHMCMPLLFGVPLMPLSPFYFCYSTQSFYNF